jgi:dUTP pyrophosphatase
MTQETLRIKRLHPAALLPRRATAHASGFDLYACLPEGDRTIVQSPVLVPTGIALEFPFGLDVQVRPRSSLSRLGLVVPLGTIDADYRGELFVTMYAIPALGSYTVRHGDRIAQLVVARLAEVAIQEVQDLTPTARGPGGHGSTGA